MTRKIHLLFALVVMSLPASVFAISGGPFDNGDYSQTLDNQGIYQTTMRFSDGTGFSQWGTNVTFTPPITSGTSTTTTASTLGSVLNRSLIYFKGMTFFGIASGVVDHDRAKITGITNGSSDASSSVNQASNSSVNGANYTNDSVNIVSNGLNYTCNTEYEATIDQEFPILKFSGTGQITVINPSTSATTTTTATGQSPSTIIAGWVTTLVSSVQATNFGGLSAAITALSDTSIVNILAAAVNVSSTSGSSTVSTSIDQVAADSTQEDMTVFGSRIFVATIR